MTAQSRHQHQTNHDVRSETQGAADEFIVTIDEFSGPFDVLLGLIADKKLDVTKMALADVTDDFLAYVRSREDEGQWPLDEATSFLVIAATLLDYKAARLLPGEARDDDELFAALDASDLLFARLLQYRAFKKAATDLAERFARAALAHPRRPALEAELAGVLPHLRITFGPERLALAMVECHDRRKADATTVSTAHIHAPPVSLVEQVAVLTEYLQAAGRADFDAVCDADQGPMMVSVRFLAALELYREQRIDMEQIQPFGPLTLIWDTPTNGTQGHA